MIDELYRDPMTHRMLHAVLRSRGVAQDLEDVVQDVFVALIEWSARKRVESLAALRAGARDIADKVGKSYKKKQRRRAKRDVGPTGDADDHSRLPNPSAIELVDVGKILAEISNLLDTEALTPKAGAVLLALADETTLSEYAEETQQSYAALRQAHSRAQAKLIAHLQSRNIFEVGLEKLHAAGPLVAVAVAVFLILLHTGRLRSFRNDPVAHDLVKAPVPEVAPVEPLESFMARTQERREKAAAALIAAEVAYKRMQWRVCIQQVQAARKLDPDSGDRELETECALQEERMGNSKAPPRGH
jgi:DNA-directed RNA polymerase specialized sigma24 family protein